MQPNLSAVPGSKMSTLDPCNPGDCYGAEKKLTEMISRLENMGFSPYVIKGSKGESRLILGAYITRTGAEQQTQDLKSKGISVQVIRR